MANQTQVWIPLKLRNLEWLNHFLFPWFSLPHWLILRWPIFLCFPQLNISLSKSWVNWNFSHSSKLNLLAGNQMLFFTVGIIVSVIFLSLLLKELQKRVLLTGSLKIYLNMSSTINNKWEKNLFPLLSKIMKYLLEKNKNSASIFCIPIIRHLFMLHCEMAFRNKDRNIKRQNKRIKMASLKYGNNYLCI